MKTVRECGGEATDGDNALRSTFGRTTHRLPSRSSLQGTVRIKMNSELLELLVTREMPFGKYQGRIIADLPGHYLGWFAREGFPSGQLGQLLALMYELDHNNLVGLLDPLRLPH